MKCGILVISHGSREADWVEQVDRTVRAAASSSALRGVPVISAFLEIVEGRLIQDGINELVLLGVTDMLVIPMFVSSGSTHVEEIRQAFGLEPQTSFKGDLGLFDVSCRFTFGQPVDAEPEIAQLLFENIVSLTAAPSEEALLLITHGSKEPVFHERYVIGMAKLAQQVQAIGGFARAEYALLLPDQAAETLKAMQVRHPEEEVIVIPVFLSPGYFTNDVVPARLKGLHYRYNGRAMLPHPYMADWLTVQGRKWLDGKM